MASVSTFAFIFICDFLFPILKSAYASLASAGTWDFVIFGPDMVWKYTSVGEWSSSSSLCIVILWAFLFLGFLVALGGLSCFQVESFVSLVRQATAKCPVFLHFPQVFPFAGHSPL